MSLSTFHPASASWFREALGAPTDVQAEAWPLIREGRNVLIAAPTGSGKTLAAFFSIIDELLLERLAGTLADETRVLYVSPLKALTVDIHKNLQSPLAGIEARLAAAGQAPANIRVQVRTGDTPASQRTAMAKSPPHILATTPESLYLLLTSDSGRRMLRTVRTVIVDEIHAVVGSKRGSHLALSMERLERLTAAPPVRIGLSATQKPIEEVAKFLTAERECAVIDAGHKRALDLAIEIPRSPLTAVMAQEVWNEVYDRLVELIETHKTTLIFVNTRRLAERMAHNLSNRLGADAVTAHHGSMSKENRLDAEERLKAGTLRALVATASLELGIDIGAVDLVCQMGSPRVIHGFLQRVGRSGHTVGGTPKGRLFPLGRSDLVECIAILDSVHRGELDRVEIPQAPSDVLAQQLVAELACDEYGEDDLYDMVRRAYPYRHLARGEFDRIMTMLSEGFTTRAGRRRAYVHRDLINSRARGRRNARLTAIVSGGVIPDNFDYDVILEPQGAFIGNLNEDFAIESMAGDVVQLGNHSWRILGVSNGQVRVEDAGDLAPGIPFWFGEGRGRSDELSHSVSRLNDAIRESLERGSEADAVSALVASAGIDRASAEQAVAFLAAARAALGTLPSTNEIVMERFFDEVGDMHLVIHAPFGSRVNRAWGLALRKCFCRKFNFELQAAATEDAILLSLGPTHSFPLEEVFDYLNPVNVRDLLVQALLDSPMFKVRWRWNASTALAVIRRRAGKRVPPQFQRMQAEDLIAVVFPDQLACPENLPGDREIPDHPLVKQTIDDCLHEAMDIDGFLSVLTRLRSGEIGRIARDLTEPSPLSEDVLNARPYSFLDDAPLEERRVQAVRNRRWLDASEAAELAVLDVAAIERVRQEAWPLVRDASELHDALSLGGFLTAEEGGRGDGTTGWEPWFDELVASGRATLLRTSEGSIDLWVSAERAAQVQAAIPGSTVTPAVHVPAQHAVAAPSPEEAAVEVVRSRLEMLGPVRAQEIADSMSLKLSSMQIALAALESEGFVVQGKFTPGVTEIEWCERRLLARIHRATIQRLRREIEPVTQADFMRFLFAWHGLGSDREGSHHLRVALEQLEGFEASAAAWESDILPARVRDYEPSWLDALCMSGSIVWGRFRVPPRSETKRSATPIKTTPLSLVSREHLDTWRHFASDAPQSPPSGPARQVLEALTTRGALFFDELVRATGLLRVQAEEAIAELVASGDVTSDGFSGLRALLVDSKYRTNRWRSRGVNAYTMESGGRWSLLRMNAPASAELTDDDVETCARVLLTRYGVVFRRLADRETMSPPWRDLVRVYRRLEARGEIRGGRFVDGVWGEQFAVIEAVAELRAARRRKSAGESVSISASDPLNLTGVLASGDRVGALPGNRILYRDGVPIAVKEGGEVRMLAAAHEDRWAIEKALVSRPVPPSLRPYLGKGVRK